MCTLAVAACDGVQVAMLLVKLFDRTVMHVGNTIFIILFQTRECLLKYLSRQMKQVRQDRKQLLSFHGSPTCLLQDCLH